MTTLPIIIPLRFGDILAILLILAVLPSTTVGVECFAQVTYTESCIVITSCHGDQVDKLIKPFASADITAENCSYDGLTFKYDDKECKKELQGLDPNEVNKQNSTEASEFQDLGMNYGQKETLNDPLTQMQMVALSGCDLENHLADIDELEYDLENNALKFVKRQVQQYFIII